MNKKSVFLIEFASIKVKFVFPTEIPIPKEFLPFLCDCIPFSDTKYDVEYTVELLEQPLQISEQPIARCYAGMEIYTYKDHQLRVYSPLTTESGCQVACLLMGNRNILYYPASRWKYYAQEWRSLHLLGIEEILLQYQALLLHSSVVHLHEQVVLFSGPSGAGKSTQAALWEKYLGADILNGDRCIIRKKADGFYGCGSPWSGTSGIYRREQAPIKGIFILSQSQENTVIQTGIDGFKKLFQQCIVNSWNSSFVSKLMDLLIELIQTVPVYELACRPEEDAVQLAYNTLFGRNKER